VSQYVDMETGEIIDAVQFRREQARIATRQKNMRARKSRIYRHVGLPEPQTFPQFLHSIPRTLWDKHYGQLMGVLGLLATLVWWMWSLPR
jgi:hypothetical protein